MPKIGSIIVTKQSTRNEQWGGLNQPNKKLQMNLEETSNQAN